MFGKSNNNPGINSPEGNQEGTVMNNEQNYQQPGDGSDQQYNRAGDPVFAAGRKVRNPNLPYKSPALATWLSLFPGLGQTYIGYYQLGFMYVVVMALCILVLSLGILAPFIGPMLAFFWIFNLIDANRRATHYNRSLEGMEQSDVPPDFEMPNLKGSLPMGILLMVLGFLILLDLNYGVSMEWIEDWWPLALVGFGGWLIFKGRQKDK